MQNFQPNIKIIEDEAKRKLTSKKSSRSRKVNKYDSIIRPFSFSDSIILVSNDDSQESAESLLFWVEWVMSQAILDGIPIKGAIAHGKQTSDFDNNIHFGKPLIDAFELQNELNLYGCVLHHTMEQYLVKTGMIKYFEDIDLFKMDVPFKVSGNIKQFIVDWTYIGKKSLPSALLRLYGTTSGSTRSYVDNTVNFVETIRKQKEEIKKRKRNSSNKLVVKRVPKNNKS